MSASGVPKPTEASPPEQGGSAGGDLPAEALLQQLQLHQTELEAQNRQLREAQASLELSRARYVALYDCAPVAYVGLDAFGVIREINLPGAVLLGAEPTALVGLPFAGFVSRPHVALFRSHMRECIKRGVALGPIELTLSRPGQEAIVVQVQSVPYDDPSRGERLCRMAVSDVTPLARARENEAQSLRQYKALLSGIPDAVVRISPEDRLLDVHLPPCALPLKAEDLLGRQVEDVVPRALAADVAPLLAQVRQSQAPVQLERRVALGGRVRWLELRLVASGAEVTVLCRDVSELREAQARLNHAERLATLGTLSAGLAHEVNNPLAFVLLSVELAERALAASSAGAPPKPGALSAAEALADARTGAERIQRIVEHLHAFARPGEGERTRVNPRVALDRAVKLAQHQLEHRARLVRSYVKLPEVLANEAQLGQVFLNLLVNAAQALDEGAADRNEVRITTRVDPEGRALIEIADTGRGMSPEELTRAFDPFFTTKAAGLGLGLALAQSAVRAVGGELTAESIAGRGSTFRVRLPPAPPDVEPEAPHRPRRASSAERLRILVVDDDANFGRSLGIMLGFDHEVLLLQHARLALEQIREGLTFDAVLCDVMMPEMTGEDFFEELERVAPELCARVIFMTGGAFTPAMRAFLERVPNPRITKPFRSTELEELLRALRRAPPG